MNNRKLLFAGAISVALGNAAYILRKYIFRKPSETLEERFVKEPHHVPLPGDG